MITRSNIVEFFEQYKRNLEREEALNEAVLDAEDQEVWMENLRAKSRGLRQIYVENEALLNLYLRPFLEQESRLTKELAAEFLKGLVDLGEQGVCDRLVCIRTGKLLRRFFEKENDRDSLLITVHVLHHKLHHFYHTVPHNILRSAIAIATLRLSFCDSSMITRSTCFHKKKTAAPDRNLARLRLRCSISFGTLFYCSIKRPTSSRSADTRTRLKSSFSENPTSTISSKIFFNA